jgi:hypothetical protein
MRPRRAAAVPLSERGLSFSRSPVTPAPVAGREPAPVVLGAGRRHCWVLAGDGPPREGLVLQWRKDPTGWSGLVVHVEPGDRAVTAWFPAERLRPAT